MEHKDADSSDAKLDALMEGRDGILAGHINGASKPTATRENIFHKFENIFEKMLSRENMLKALQRVESNKGAAGCDGMEVSELRSFLKEKWLDVKLSLLNNTYYPSPVKRVEIPKPNGKGIRLLGIPTVLDRLLQQALQQVLSPIFDPSFSQSSYGFRPNRSAHQAVERMREHISEGRRWVVDIDLEKFFDRVNHDILMSRLARRISDKKVLLLIRRFLQAGVMDNGLFYKSEEGTPQGGPLSPLLSNILLDDLDKEIEKRGHKFCRYADDCNIYVRSKASGERVLTSLTRFIESKLKLKVNAEKSAVARPWARKFLGYTVSPHKKSRLWLSRESLQRFKGSLKQLFRQSRGRNVPNLIKETLIPRLRGWISYFYKVEALNPFELLDHWIRRRLRWLYWRQWKRPSTRRKKLMKRGLSEERARKSAYNGHGPWWNSGSSHLNEAFKINYFIKLGLISLLDESRRLKCST
jgi:RNA-directed DNA polymerase